MSFFSSVAKIVGSGVLPRSVSKKFLPDSVERAIYGDANMGQATAVAAPAQSRQQAVETPTSGNITLQSQPMPIVQPAQGFVNFIPQIAQRAPQIGRTIRDVAVGVGATSFLGGDSPPMGIFGVRINEKGTLTGLSRKEQRQAKQLVEFVGFEQAADIIGVNEGVMAMILVKKFGAGGKGITAAQLRNAQRVNNRIVHMHKQLESSFKKSTTAARRRTSNTRTTVIKN